MGLYDSEVKRYPINIPCPLYERFDIQCKRAYKKKAEVVRDLIFKFCLISESVDMFPDVRVNDRIEDSAGFVARAYHRIIKDWWRKNG